MRKILILAMILVTLTGCFGKKKEEKKNPDAGKIIEVKEQDVIENKEYSGIKIENISFIYDGKYTTMSFTLINSRTENVTLGKYDVIVNDENGEEIGKLESYSAEEITPEGVLEFSLSIDKDYSKAKSVEFNFIDLNGTVNVEQ